jgi:DNA-binding CsgD family transcriptional regulator
MSNVATAVRWNAAPYAVTTELTTQPSWMYYSQVSITNPHRSLVDIATPTVGSLCGGVADQVGARTERTGETLVPAQYVPTSIRGADKPFGPWSLTQRELEVIQLLAEGATNCEIADRLYISQKTTKNHLASIFQKLDVTNRTQALVRAVVMGLVSIE